MKNTNLQNSLGYHFNNPSNLLLALSHRSIGKLNNERLEFLGDSLLNLIIAEALYQQFTAAKEGDLSRLRSSLVKGETLAELAREFSLGDHLILGEGELKSGGFRRASILADTVEAIIGAIYLEAGMEECKKLVLKWFKSRLENCSPSNTSKDPKTLLQEYLQEQKKPLPNYRVVRTLGEAHSMEFVVECVLGTWVDTTTATGSSKRVAEKLAAEKMLIQLGVDIGDK